MRFVLKLAALAASTACILGPTGPAAAQNFGDRWSIVPNANAEQPAEPGKPVEAPTTGQPNVENPPEPPRPSIADAPMRGPNDQARAQVSRHSFTGKASFYSYAAGKTASGAMFNRNSATAAHRNLPFGTKVRVTNLKNQKSVIVTITDRGPHSHGRVLDLSLAAARAIDMIDRGVAQVRAEVL